MERLIEEHTREEVAPGQRGTLEHVFVAGAYSELLVQKHAQFEQQRTFLVRAGYDQVSRDDV